MSRPSCRSRPGPGSFVLIDKKHIVNMGETSEDFWQRFAVNLQSGIIYSKGNQTTQYNISSSVTYARPRWAAASTSTPPFPRTRAPTPPPATSSASMPITCCRGRTTSCGGQVGFLQSTEQGIDLRTNVGGGVGKYLKHSGRVSVSLLGGLGWQNTNYSPTEESEGTPGHSGPAGQQQPAGRDLQQDQPGSDRQRAPGALRARPFLLQHQRQLLRQALEQPHLQPVVLRQLGHQAAGDATRPAITASAPDWDGASGIAGRRSRPRPSGPARSVPRPGVLQSSTPCPGQRTCTLPCGPCGAPGPLASSRPSSWPPAHRRARRPTCST